MINRVTNVMTMVEVENLFPACVAKAEAIIDMVCEQYNCKWYQAIEDFGAYELMEEAGVNPEVIAAICYEI
jgi:hypothetical protein